MLPLYAARTSKKMNRHGYTGSLDNKTPTSPVPFTRTNTSGESGRGFKIKTDKWEKYQPRSRGGGGALLSSRKATLTRFGGLLSAILLLLLYFFPALRPTNVIEYLFPPGEEFNIETVRYYDLSNVGGTSRGWEREERILLCAPLRDAAPHLPMFFSHLKNLTYPHNLIDLAFLVGDSKDNTAELLSDLLADLQAPDNPPKDWFGEISVIEKDFGQVVNQDVESRHGFAAQAGRRKSMAQARNWLLSAALRPVHSWVYWRDVDVETAPFTILEDLMRHNKDIIVPNVWRPLPEWLGGEQPYDLNSWQESETALALAETLDEDAVIVEGYAEYATWRPHLAYLRDPYGDPDMEMEIDGVGGVSILAKARVFRSGVHFPAFSFERHAETEGFGKMAKRMQFSVVGLPHYTIWHLYEPSFEDIRHMEEMEQERKIREEQERMRKERLEKIEHQFDTDAKRQFEKDKEAMREARKDAAVDAAVEESVVQTADADDEEAERADERVPVAGAEVRKLQEEGRWRREKEKSYAEVRNEVEGSIEAAERRAGEAAAAAAAAGERVAKGRERVDEVTRDEVKAGIAESEVSFERDAQGKLHISDPLGEIKELGGGPGSPSLEREKEKERAAIAAAEVKAAEREQAKVDAEDALADARERREDAERVEEVKAGVKETDETSEEDGWRDPRKLNLQGGR